MDSAKSEIGIPKSEISSYSTPAAANTCFAAGVVR